MEPVAAKPSGGRRPRLKPFAHGMPLSLVIVRYFAYIIVGVGVVWLAALALLSGAMNVGAVYPANYGAAHIGEMAQGLRAQNEFDSASIPTAYRFARFDEKGTLLSSDLPEKKQAGAWNIACELLEKAGGAVVGASQADIDEGRAVGDVPITGIGGTTYAAFELADGTICLITTEYLPQYVSPELRESLPNPQNLMLWGAGLGSVAVVALVARRASRVISRKLEPLANAAQRIAHEDLEFEVGTSNVRQVNDVLDAMERMRASLKDSLEARWRTEQAQRDQVAALAHDLKTPLTVVRANVEFMAETAGEAAAGGERDGFLAAARDANEATEKLDAYVCLLVDASRGGCAAETKEPLAADFVADEISHEAAALARAAGIELHVACAPELTRYRVNLDQQSLNRAIINAVSNAFDHAQSTVRVSFDIACGSEAGANQGRIAVSPLFVVTISDDGPGFSPQALEHGCERFFRGDASRKGAVSGQHYGLGLFTAAEILQAHEGDISLVNKVDTAGCITGAAVTARVPACPR